MTTAYLGIGSNIGNREENLRSAVLMLSRAGSVTAVSSLYRSLAVVLEGSEPGPDFRNAACALDTQLTPEELLGVVKSIEYDIGRRPGPRWAARPIDIDILLFGDAIVDLPGLIIPHPLVHERNFVLAPLADIAPSTTHPLLQAPVELLAHRAGVEGLVRLRGPDWIDVAAHSLENTLE